MSFRRPERRALVSTVSMSATAQLYAAFRGREKVTGRDTAPAIAMLFNLWAPRISLALTEVVVEGTKKRRGEEDNMDAEQDEPRRGSSKALKYGSMKRRDVVSPCTVVAQALSDAALHPTFPFHCATQSTLVRAGPHTSFPTGYGNRQEIPGLGRSRTGTQAGPSSPPAALGRCHGLACFGSSEPRPVLPTGIPTLHGTREPR